MSCFRRTVFDLYTLIFSANQSVAPLVHCTLFPQTALRLATPISPCFPALFFLHDKRIVSPCENAVRGVLEAKRMAGTSPKPRCPRRKGSLLQKQDHCLIYSRFPKPCLFHRKPDGQTTPTARPQRSTKGRHGRLSSSRPRHQRTLENICRDAERKKPLS